MSLVRATSPRWKSNRNFDQGSFPLYFQQERKTSLSTGLVVCKNFCLKITAMRLPVPCYAKQSSMDIIRAVFLTTLLPIMCRSSVPPHGCFLWKNTVVSSFADKVKHKIAEDLIIKEVFQSINVKNNELFSLPNLYRLGISQSLLVNVLSMFKSLVS